MLRNTTLLLLAAFFAATVHGQKNTASPAAWLKKNTHAIQADSTGSFADLQFLKPILNNKRVVLLGESTHGAADYYALKSRLVEFLYREMGFEVIAMESGIADIYLKYQQTDTISARQLRNETVFGNFHCAEIMPLFNLIKNTRSSPRPLLYAGFDSQNFSFSLELLKEIIAAYDTAAARQIHNDLYKYYNVRNYLWQTDKQPLFRLSDTVTGAARQALQLVSDNEADIRSRYRFTARDMTVIKKGIRNYIHSMQLDWNRENPIEKRDSLMAANLFWLMDSLYAGKKIIIWAHNGHIGKTSLTGVTDVWMGERLQRRLGDQAYHIGLFAREGSYYEWWTRSEKPFRQQLPNQLEQQMSAAGKAVCFLHLEGIQQHRANRWLFRPVLALEPENNMTASFVPVKRFDGLIFFNRVRPPVYER